MFPDQMEKMLLGRNMLLVFSDFNYSFNFIFNLDANQKRPFYPRRNFYRFARNRPRGNRPTAGGDDSNGGATEGKEAAPGEAENINGDGEGGGAPRKEQQVFSSLKIIS